MLKFWWMKFILIGFLTGVAEGLIGFKFYQNDEKNCGLSLYHLPDLTEADWIKLDTHYPFNCYDIMAHPNQAHFTLATNFDGEVFIAAIFADEKVYRVTYLEPDSNEFMPLKELIMSDNCFHKDARITALLNFRDDGNAKKGGKILISQPAGCQAIITEQDFFSNASILGILKKFQNSSKLFKTSKFRGRPAVSMDDNEANNEIYELIQQNPNKLDNMILYSDKLYAPFISPFSISNPSMFVSGNYAILKNVEYNVSLTKQTYTYALIDMTKPQPWNQISTVFEWPNFVYIFDEKYFGRRFSQPPIGVQDDVNNSGNIGRCSEILIVPLMLAFVARICKMNFF